MVGWMGWVGGALVDVWKRISVRTPAVRGAWLSGAVADEGLCMELCFVFLLIVKILDLNPSSHVAALLRWSGLLWA